MGSVKWTSGGQAFLGAVATLLLGHAKGPGWWRTTQRAFGQARATADRQTTSQSVTRPGPNPTNRTARTARTLPASDLRSTGSSTGTNPVSTSSQEVQTRCTGVRGHSNCCVSTRDRAAVGRYRSGDVVPAARTRSRAAVTPRRGTPGTLLVRGRVLPNRGSRQRRRRAWSSRLLYRGARRGRWASFQWWCLAVARIGVQ
jgi:hypothetical protein